MVKYASKVAVGCSVVPFAVISQLLCCAAQARPVCVIAQSCISCMSFKKDCFKVKISFYVSLFTLSRLFTEHSHAVKPS